jgi:hypothetical protein
LYAVTDIIFEGIMKRATILGVILILLLSSISVSNGVLIKKDNDENTYPISLFKTKHLKEPPIEWNTTIHEGWYDRGRYIEKRDDGFLIIGDFTYDTDTDIGIIKTDPNGNVEWKKIIELYHDNPIRRIVKTWDNGYIITGNIQRGIRDIVWGVGKYVVKVDPFGNEQWNITIYDEDVDIHHIYYFDKMLSLSDNGFLIGGISYFDNGSITDPFLMKVDEDGNIEWTEFLLLKNISSISFMYETGDNHYLVGSGRRVYKISQLRSVIWETKYEYENKIFRIDEVNPDEFQLIMSNKDKKSDIYFVTIDGMGEVIDSHVIGEQYRVRSVKKTSDEGYIILGAKDSKYFLIKINNEGMMQWNTSFQFDIDFYIYHNHILIEDMNQGFFFFYFSYDENPANGYYNMFKIDDDGKEEWNKTIYPGSCDSYLKKYSISEVVQADDFGYVLLGTKNIPNELNWEFDDVYDIYLMKLSGVILEMRGIKGGKTVSLTLDNDGYDHYSNVDWSISFDGALWNWSNSSGCIDVLEAGNETKIQSNPLFGFGPGNVTITVEDLLLKQPVFYLGPFIIIKRGILESINFTNSTKKMIK